MAWGVPKLGTEVVDATGNFTLIEPAGVAQGDLMVACLAMRNGAVVSLSGWTQIQQVNTGDTDATNGIASAAMFYVVRGASAPNLAATRTAGDVVLARIISYSGGSSTPLDVSSVNTLASASTTVTTGSLTTAEPGELIVAMMAGGDVYSSSAFDAATDPATASGATDTTTAPTAGTWIERHDSTTGTGADTGLGIADAIRATAGSTGTIQVTASGSGRSAMIAAAFKLAPAVTQAAYRFYEDGTESGSTAIDAQDTNITRDVSGGNSLLFLRIRLQETNGADGSTTDDYQLQQEHSADPGVWVNVDSTQTGRATYSTGSSNVTDGGATTNRLGAGSGSFIGGQIVENIGGAGLVLNHQLTANSYTEHLFVTTVLSANVSDGDTIDFRVLLNGATTGMTHTVTPRITVSKPISLAQAAFRFYEDGTESGSTAIDAQDTNITRDVTSDSNLALRVRVQETDGASGNSTDDYQLQYSLNSGTYADLAGSASSYSESNYDTTLVSIYDSTNAGVSQSFPSGSGGVLSQSKFYIKKVGSPTGNVVSKLYAITGSSGTNGKPTGAALATSDNIDVSTISTSIGLSTFTFTGANKYSISSATDYCITIEYTGGDASNRIDVGYDTTTLGAAGNESALQSGTWNTHFLKDVPYYVYVDSPVLYHASTNLTDGGATTERLVGIKLEADTDTTGTTDAGSGDFIISRPATVNTDDVLVAHITTSGGSSMDTVPSGWTIIYENTAISNPRVYSYYKVVTNGGTEPSTYTFSTASLGIAYSANITRWSGVDTSTPIDGTPTASSDVAGLTITAPAVTTGSANSVMVVHAGSNSSTTTHTSTDLTEYFDPGAGKAGFGGYVAQASAGSTGTKVITISASREWAVNSFALKSASGILPGSGSFVAGEVSEDGLVDNHQITASNYTEHLYTLTVVSAAVADTDTLDFRVLRNSATTGMTYTVTPRITVSNTGGSTPTNQFFSFF